MVRVIIEDKITNAEMQFYENDIGKFYFEIKPVKDYSSFECITIDKEQKKIIVKELNNFING